MTDKKFFRIRLVEKSPLKSKIVNGLAVTKQWQVKVGEIGDFAKFSDVEAQVVVKQGNGFVPVDEGDTGATAGSDGGDTGATAGSDGGSGQLSGPASTPAQDAEEAQTIQPQNTEETQAIETRGTEEPQTIDSQESESPPNFSSMTVEQLKTFLIANGAAQNELRNVAKSDLIERAEFIWSQNK